MAWFYNMLVNSGCTTEIASFATSACALLLVACFLKFVCHVFKK